MLDAVTRPAKALVYGTALFRYTHSPLILSISPTAALLSFRKQQRLEQARKKRSFRYCTVVTLCDNQPLFAPCANNHFSQRTITPLTHTKEHKRQQRSRQDERRNEQNRRHQKIDQQPFFLILSRGDIVSALCSMSSRSSPCSWCLSQSVSSSR